MRTVPVISLLLAAAAAAGLVACNSDSPTSPGNGTDVLDIAVCAPGATAFSAAISNPFFPLPVGARWVLEGVDEGARVRLVITSLAQTEMVAGVETRVVEERESADGELVEVSRNFFAQTPDGTVCYYGEDVDIYEGGIIVSHEGAWRAGGASRPGIFLPGNPQVGQEFQQEVAPGVAVDEATIVAMGEMVQVPLGTFGDTLRLDERNPLDGGRSTKVCARGTGLIVDDALRRIE